MTVLRPAAVVFDWDDTLIDNWGAIRNALNAAFVAMGHETWTLAETRARSAFAPRHLSGHVRRALD
jgi:phosphoglycolate phosphatase-like HAD superfamily hydrolase